MEGTLLEQAIAEMKQINEAAEKVAMAKLAKAMPKEFDKFLKEELSKKENIKESTTVGKKKESQKVNESFTDMPQESSVEEGWANEELSSGQPTEVGTGEVTNDCGCDDKNGEVLDMTGLTIDDIEQAYNDATSNDEIEVVKDAGMSPEDGASAAGASDAEAEGDVLDQDAIMNDIEAELDQMGDEAALSGEEGVVNPEDSVEESGAQQVSDPFEFMKKMHEELTNAIKGIEEQMSVQGYNQEFDTKMQEMYGDGFKDVMGEQKYNEMFEMYKSHKMADTNKTGIAPETQVDANASNGAVTETEVVATDAIVKEEDAPVATGTETEIEEAHGVALSANKKVSGTNAPNLDHKQYAKDKVRSALQTEGENKKFSALLEENKKLTKKINENKKQVSDLSGMIQEYQGALDKYRKQLSEMAVFNNNLAHVNNILVNESFALTAKEKKQIIERFKGVSSLDESEKTYKAVLSEMTEAKKPIIESIEDKISNVVEPSSADRLGTVVENTAYVNEHVNKIKKLISYVDKRGK